jgi:hypothetical protein
MQYFFSINYSCHKYSPLFHSSMHGLTIPCILYTLPYLFLAYSYLPSINGIDLSLPLRDNHKTCLNPCATLLLLLLRDRELP